MIGDRWYEVEDVAEVASPALLVWPERVERNITRMLELVNGETGRLRPHVKTHKSGEVVRMQADAGIRKFKCATIAEVEMTAEAGADEVLLAYQPVGPNVDRLAVLATKFPQVRIAALVDDPGAAEKLSRRFQANGARLPVLVDIDCGMHRTGIELGDRAVALCAKIADLHGLEFAGLHVYDGHVHDAGLDSRESAFDHAFAPLAGFVEKLRGTGIDVPVIVAGGSPTFALHAREGERVTGVDWQCSPGTTLYWDAGYGGVFPDLGFIPAAALLARVISKPGANRICLDLGHKAVSAENPIDKRVRFFGLEDARPVAQSEEHLVMEMTPDRAASFAVGDVVYGLPWHVCPTVALHQEAVIVRDGKTTGEKWRTRARDRRITV